MKQANRFLTIGTALLLGMGVLITSIVRVARPRAFFDVEAVDEEATGAGENLVVAEEATESGKVDYYLAYPGILPDHPLYFLKMIRDRIRLMLTTKPEKKAELMLLYADKRVGAALALAEGNRHSLAVTTATKAEKYYDQVVAELGKVDPGEAVELSKRVVEAGDKHIEVLEGILATLPDSMKPVLEQAKQLVVEGESRVKELMKAAGVEVMEKGEVEEAGGGGMEGEGEGRL